MQEPACPFDQLRVPSEVEGQAILHRPPSFARPSCRKRACARFSLWHRAQARFRRVHGSSERVEGNAFHCFARNNSAHGSGSSEALRPARLRGRSMNDPGAGRVWADGRCKVIARLLSFVRRQPHNRPGHADGGNDWTAKTQGGRAVPVPSGPPGPARVECFRPGRPQRDDRRERELSAGSTARYHAMSHAPTDRRMRAQTPRRPSGRCGRCGGHRPPVPPGCRN